MASTTTIAMTSILTVPVGLMAKLPVCGVDIHVNLETHPDTPSFSGSR